MCALTAMKAVTSLVRTTNECAEQQTMLTDLRAEYARDALLPARPVSALLATTTILTTARITLRRYFGEPIPSPMWYATTRISSMASRCCSMV